MSKLSELKHQIVYLSISLLSFIAVFVMPYFEGRSNTVWEFLLIPADIVPLFLLFVCSTMLLFYTIGAFRTKRHVFAVLLMFLLSLVLFASWFSVDRWCSYQLGLSDYAKHILTPKEWRDISRFAQENIAPNGHLWGPQKTVQDYDERQLWSEFTNQTEIQKLGPYVMISVHADPAPKGLIFSSFGYTEIEWGGALVGHRGVVIYSNTNNTSSPDGAVSGVMFITPDIGTFILY